MGRLLVVRGEAPGRRTSARHGLVLLVGPESDVKRRVRACEALLGLDVEDQFIDVLDLSPESVGTFDPVLFLGVLYHLRDPISAAWGSTRPRTSAWFATRTYQQSREVRLTQDLLGHRSPATTAIYAQVSPVEAVSTVMQLPNLGHGFDLEP